MDERTRQLLAINDPVLEPFLAADDEETRHAALQHIIVEHARPVAAKVLSRYRRGDRALAQEDAEDIISTVLVRVIRKLQEIQSDEAAAVTRFDHYVATLAFNAFYDFLRRRFPERTRLKNRVRHLLTRDRRFAVWLIDDRTACGYRRWLGSQELGRVDITRTSASPRMLNQNDAAAAVSAIFDAAGGPLLLEELLRVLAELWNVIDPIGSTAREETAAETQLSEMESRQYFAAMWDEIRLLPPRQATALLLNLRDADGENALALFVLLGIATFDELARTLGMTPEELGALWSRLPIDDTSIAARLGMTRQQVINLRRSARDRLARRMSSRQ